MGKKKFQKLSAEDLTTLRGDPGLESKRGIEDYVFCRECGEGPTALTIQHLWRHNLTKPEHQTRWPLAPLASTAYRNIHSKAGRARRARQI